MHMHAGLCVTDGEWCFVLEWTYAVLQKLLRGVVDGRRCVSSSLVHSFFTSHTIVHPYDEFLTQHAACKEQCRQAGNGPSLTSTVSHRTHAVSTLYAAATHSSSPTLYASATHAFCSFSSAMCACNEETSWRLGPGTGGGGLGVVCVKAALLKTGEVEVSRSYGGRAGECLWLPPGPPVYGSSAQVCQSLQLMTERVGYAEWQNTCRLDWMQILSKLDPVSERLYVHKICSSCVYAGAGVIQPLLRLQTYRACWTRAKEI
eukprot:368857-Pelagomonas_calceolata.AAC.11